MVKGGWEPGGGIVTRLAAGAKRTIVRIILGMAGIAGIINRNKYIVQMAFCALDRCMGTGEWEFRLRVIECSRRPAAGAMASATISTQLTLMSIILGMAGIAILRSRLQVSNAACTAVAAGTVHLGVLASKLEGDVIVIEVMSIGINPIMTSQAGLPKCLQVCQHKICLELLMAGGANGLVKLQISISVAGLTHEWRAIGLFLVGGEGEAKRIVGNISLGKISKRSICSTMIGVAGAARMAGVFLLLHSMQRGRINELGSDIRMACQALIIHRRRLPEVGMAGGTFATQPSMGGNATQTCTRLGIQRSRAEKLSTEYDPHPDDNQDYQHPGNYSEKCQATERSFFHRFTVSAATWRK